MQRRGEEGEDAADWKGARGHRAEEWEGAGRRVGAWGGGGKGCGDTAYVAETCWTAGEGGCLGLGRWGVDKVLARGRRALW